MRQNLRGGYRGVQAMDEGSSNAKGEADSPEEQNQIRQSDPYDHGGGQAGLVPREGPTLIAPEKPTATCDECEHPVTLHDEDGFCTVPGCGCEGPDEEPYPEAPLIRSDY